MMNTTTASQVVDGPCERVRRAGVDVLSDTELLALLLASGRANDDDLASARALLRAHEGLRGVARTGFGVLARDLGERKAARVVAALEIARRSTATALSRAVAHRSSRDVVRAFAPRLIDAPEESVIAIVLDGRQRPIAERSLAHGAPNACAVTARQVFALAVREGGAGVLLVHNHPSGDPTPSAEDIKFTRAVLDAGRLLDLPLLDHVIVAREGSFSFLDAGLLPDLDGR